MNIKKIGLIFVFLVALNSCGLAKGEDDVVVLENVEMQERIDDLEGKLAKLESDNLSLKEEIDGLVSKSKPETKDNSGSIEYHNYVVNYDNGEIKFVAKPQPQNSYSAMTLIGYNTQFNDDVIEVIDLSNDSEYKECYNIFGTLLDFRVVIYKWDEKTQDYIEADEIYYVDTITNKTVILDSSLYEGHSRFMKIEWKDLQGESFSYTVSENGYGFSDSILICEQYSSN